MLFNGFFHSGFYFHTICMVVFSPICHWHSLMSDLTVDWVFSMTDNSILEQKASHCKPGINLVDEWWWSAINFWHSAFTHHQHVWTQQPERLMILCFPVLFFVLKFLLTIWICFYFYIFSFSFNFDFSLIFSHFKICFFFHIFYYYILCYYLGLFFLF